MLKCKNQQCLIRRRMIGATKQVNSEQLKIIAGEFQLNSGDSLLEAAKSSPVALVFLRHFGCTFTRQILRGLENLEQSAAKHGAQLILVHMLKKGEEIRYLAGHSPVARIADPDCKLYRAFGLGNGSIIELFGPRVWLLGIASIIKGCGVGGLAGNGLQMPGAFIFHHGKIIAEQRAKSAAELPDLPLLFSRVQE